MQGPLQGASLQGVVAAIACYNRAAVLGFHPLDPPAMIHKSHATDRAGPFKACCQQGALMQRPGIDLSLGKDTRWMSKADGQTG